MITRIVLFLILNFTALTLGGLSTSKAVMSDWYLNLDKAPWTPPGWFFGFAWTTIMICFSIYMAYLWPSIENKKLIVGLYLLQWILNVGWNPIFFHYHKVVEALIVIVLLTVLVGFFLFYFWPNLKFKSVLILTYFMWMLTATSLNAYVVFKN